MSDEPLGMGPGEESTRLMADLVKSGAVVAGRYKLLEAIGQGGMGSVWLAEQKEPVKRQVALKLIKPGMDSEAVLARFEAERQALALMDHPHIAKVFDGGVTEQGRPFFVMELVRGIPLTDYCDKARLTVRERLELFGQVCSAVQHAHQKGIIHRDLKPSNILVTEQDGRLVTKVIDFGLAKALHSSLTDISLHTVIGAVIGTPLYMAPEQLETTALDVDTRSDLYSLGVILYELLTGTTPITQQEMKQAAWDEVRRFVREVDPPSPSSRISSAESLPSVAAQRRVEPARLTKIVRGELDWIIMKSLEKDRNRRYETANGLAMDIQRFLSGEAVLAAPPSHVNKLRKFVVRNRGAVTAGCLLFLTLVGGIAGTSYGLLQAQKAAKAEEIAKDDALVKKELAEKQRTRAEAREQEAIDAVKRFGEVVAENPILKNSPQLEDLRKTLLKEPFGFFKSLRERLQADAETRPESLARLATVGFSLGNLTNEIGDKQDALRAFEESRGIYERLVKEHPNFPAYRNGLALSYNSIGGLLIDTGKPTEALASCQKALTIQKQLAAENPTVLEHQSHLAMSHNNIGNLLSETGMLTEALDSFLNALAIQKRLAAENPILTGYQSALGNTYNSIGVLLSQTGKRTEAMAAYQDGLSIQKRLAAENPTVLEYQSDLGNTYNSIGVLLSRTGKPTEALAAYQDGLSIQKRLVAENPTVTGYQSALGNTYNSIGGLLSQTGKPREAMAAYQEALAIQKRLAAENPTVLDYQSELASSHDSIGVLLSQTGNRTEALAIQKRLAAENPTVLDYQSGLARSHNNTGILLSETGELLESLAAYQEALAIQKRLAEENLTVLEYQSELARSHFNMAITLGQVGKLDESLIASQDALSIIDRLMRENPEFPGHLHELSTVLIYIAELDLETMRLTEARERFLKAVEYGKRAVELDPGKPLFRDHLATVYKKLLTGDVRLNDPKLIAFVRRGSAELAASDPRYAELDQRMKAVVNGEQPRDNAERLAFAQRGYDTQRYGLATRFSIEAFEIEPQLKESRQTQHAYNAACAAALAASGEALDDPPADEGAKAKYRKQAQIWLLFELGQWEKVLILATQEQKNVIAKFFTHWQTDPDLVTLRGEAIKNLPEPERAAWEELWKKVTELQTKATGEK